MGGQVIELTALYRAPVTVCAQRGSGRYRTTLASRDRLVLDLEDGDRAAMADIGELVSIGCADPDGWLTGEVRVVAQRGRNGLVTTSPELHIAQRRASHRILLALPVDVAEADDDPPQWVVGETVDVSADGFSAQVPPAGIVAGDRLGVRLALPGGHLVVGEVDVVAGGPLLRVRWTTLAERERDLIVGALTQAGVGVGR
jgi:hypothetical protein